MRIRLNGVLRLLMAAMILAPLTFLGHAEAACALNGCDSSTLFGQTQAYDVLLRGNGVAVVNARVVIDNNESTPITKLSYSLANGQLGSVAAFQEISCTDLPVLVPDGTAAPRGVTSISGTAPATFISECYPSLLEHPLTGVSPTIQSSPSFQKTQPLYYYPSSMTTYKKVTVAKSGNAFDLPLPEVVKDGKSTTIVMVYDVSGVATKKLGAFHFDFKTLKSALPVSDATVSLSVDEDYFLADTAQGKVNYRPAASAVDLNSKLNGGSALSVNSGASLDVNNYVNSIGDNGSLTKHASQLAAQETFTVTGRFAASTFLLNWPRTVLRWALFVLAVAGLVVWYIYRRRKFRGQPPADTPPTDGDPTEYNSSTEVVVSPTFGGSAQRRFKPIDLRAVPFYGLAASFRRRLRERRVRPLFFGWLCAVMTLVLLGALVGAYAFLSSTYYSYGTGIDFLYPAVFILMLAVGILGFLLLAIGLPVLYADNFKTAVRIVAHILIAWAVVGILLAVLAIRLNTTADDTGGTGCDYYSGGNYGEICPGIHNLD